MTINQQPVRLGADERRNQILETALRTFGTNGFSATSMNDVAAAAGVTKPVLYQHFDSKRHLFLELLSDTAVRLADAVKIAATSVDTGRLQVERAFAAYFGFFASDPGHFNLLYGEGVRSDPTFERELAVVENAMTEFAADLIAIDGLEHEDRVLLAAGVAGMLESAVRRWIQDAEGRSADEIASLTAELAWRGLRGAGTSHAARSVRNGRIDGSDQ